MADVSSVLKVEPFENSKKSPESTALETSTTPRCSANQSPSLIIRGNRCSSPQENGDGIAESPKKTKSLDLRLPLEMKAAPLNGRPLLRATCDIMAGHIWGPYRLAALRRCTSPFTEERSPPSHAQIRVDCGDSCELDARVNEENVWIKLLQEGTTSSEHNVETIIDINVETITVVTLAPIPTGGQFHGSVKIVPPNSSSATSKSTPPPILLTPSAGIGGGGAGGICVAGGPKRDKKCLYCGIFFSSLDTLTAHMTNYCSRRPQMSPGNTPVRTNAAPGTPAASMFTSHGEKTIDGVTEPMAGEQSSQAPVFSWPTRTTPGKRFNGAIPPTHSPHSSNRAASSSHSPCPLPRPLVDLNSVLAAAAVVEHPNLATDPLATFAATLSSLSRYRATTPLPSDQHPPAAQLQCQQLSGSSSSAAAAAAAGDKSQAMYCRGCQRFYSSSVYSSHVGISRHLSKMSSTADPQTDVAQLVEAAKRLGLVITAPLITDSGFIYVPVHPACGAESPNNVSSRAPLDLRTVKDDGATEKDLQNPPAHSNTALGVNNLLATILTGMVSGGAAGSQGTLLAPPPAPIQVPWLGGKLPDAAVLEAFLRAVTLSAGGVGSRAGPQRTAHHTHATVEATGSPAEGSDISGGVEIQRPYLCTNCQTRFQAYSTFKAHQQYYCQGCRNSKIPGDVQVAGVPGNSGTSPPPPPPQSNRSSSNSSDHSHSPKRRRIGENGANPGTLSKKPASPMSQCDSEPSPSSANRSIKGDWEGLGGGSTELRCRMCGYVGQTPRGMKMHNRLHECTPNDQHTSNRVKEIEKAPSPKPSNSVGSNSNLPKHLRAQPLC